MGVIDEYINTENELFDCCYKYDNDDIFECYFKNVVNYYENNTINQNRDESMPYIYCTEEYPLVFHFNIDLIHRYIKGLRNDTIEKLLED